MTDAPLLSIKGASKRFGAVTALDDVSLEVGAGEFFALLGPSGCGKTTLMRLVAGFETADAGRVAIKGVDMAGAPPHRRPVNLMFQSYALFPHLSVFENIAFGLRRQGRGKDEIAARVAELLKIVRLSGVETRRPDRLSGGQKQRVALARALAPGPELLLLDEPLLGLSPIMQQSVMEAIVSLKRQTGITVVLSEQFARPVLPVIDRGFVVENGMLTLSGTGAELMDNPEIKSAYFGI